MTRIKYTAKGNLVAVVSNGTAVLGLGNIGALAGKPVMEGKGVLFKRFADIDVFDIELNTHNADEIIGPARLLEPTFGGINLEDIKAPECFYIEETLRKTMKIPVFHDDQHGTAIISGAALLNALETGRKGYRAGQGRIQRRGGSRDLLCRALCPSRREAREHYSLRHQGSRLRGPHRGNEFLQGAVRPRDKTAHACRSRSRAPTYYSGCPARAPSPRHGQVDGAATDRLRHGQPRSRNHLRRGQGESRHDAIIATGRSDYPNQVNNVLGFPFIFRGALDVRATAINEEMKLAATRALAALAKEDVPDSVCRAYGVERLKFGRDYIIPKPFDPRVLVWEACAVAEAAMQTGVAQEPIDLAVYREQLERRLGKAHEIARMMIHKAQAKPKKVVFPEGENEKILRACHCLLDEKIALPVLLGDSQAIHAKAEELSLDVKGAEIIDPRHASFRERYIQELFRLRQRRGVTLSEARSLIENRNVFGSMMVHMSDADALVSGVTQHFPDVIRPALQIVRMREGLHKVSGCYAMITRTGDLYFLADTSVNIEPTAEDLVEIALCTADTARRFDVEPRVALLSFSSFGSTKHPLCEKVRKAVDLLHKADPALVVDGEVMADVAVSAEAMELTHPLVRLKVARMF